jgi:hypothetical protein
MTTKTFEMSPPATPPDLRGKDHDAAVGLMTRWFFQNFEHPAGSCPWEDGEWVFVWGGPHDARSELEWTFGDATSQEAIEAVVAELEAKSHLWAPSCSRIRQNEIGALP